MRPLIGNLLFLFSQLEWLGSKKPKQNPLLLKCLCLYKSSMLFGGKTYVAVIIYRTAGSLIHVVDMHGLTQNIFYSLSTLRGFLKCVLGKFPSYNFHLNASQSQKDNVFFQCSKQCSFAICPIFYSTHKKYCRLAQRNPKGLQRSIQV